MLELCTGGTLKDAVSMGKLKAQGRLEMVSGAAAVDVHADLAICAALHCISFAFVINALVTLILL